MRLIPIAAASLMVMLAGCGGNDSGGAGGPPRQAPVVLVGQAVQARFSDEIEAVGTAYARESTVLTSTVTERVVRLNFRDGERVRRGQIIAELARGEETADLASIEARSREAQQQLDRLKALQQRGFATNARIDAQVALVDAARAQAGAVRAQIGDRVIRAPFDGVVGLRRLSVGATAGAGTEIATVSDVSTIKLDFSVPESFLGAISVGQRIEARAAAYADMTFSGQIDGIDPVVDPVTRSVMVRAVLPNKDARLRPGMLLTVGVLSNPRDVVAVPELAVVAEGNQSFVFKVDADMTALRVPVETGARRRGQLEIKRGLAAGDRIIVEGVVKARDGGKVRDGSIGAVQPAVRKRDGTAR